MSKYKYMFANGLRVGTITDESSYLTFKDENKLPSETSGNTDDENINKIMNLYQSCYNNSLFFLISKLLAFHIQSFLLKIE
jgi:hypothetical protein